MAKALKFTKEEVQSITDLRQDVANVFTRLGQLAIEKKRRIDELDVVEQDLLNKHSDLVQKEQELFKGLNDTYGDGNYDPETNTFTPTEKNKELLKESNTNDWLTWIESDKNLSSENMFRFDLYSKNTIIKQFDLSLNLSDKAATMAYFNNTENFVGGGYYNPNQLKDLSIERFNAVCPPIDGSTASISG